LGPWATYAHESAVDLPIKALVEHRDVNILPVCWSKQNKNVLSERWSSKVLDDVLILVTLSKVHSV
jgi:hypothetical protein